MWSIHVFKGNVHPENGELGTILEPVNLEQVPITFALSQFSAGTSSWFPSLSYSLSSKVVWVRVGTSTDCLCASTAKSGGSTVAPILCWSRTKTRLLGAGLLWPITNQNLWLTYPQENTLAIRQRIQSRKDMRWVFCMWNNITVLRGFATNNEPELGLLWPKESISSLFFMAFHPHFAWPSRWTHSMVSGQLHHSPRSSPPMSNMNLARQKSLILLS